MSTSCTMKHLLEKRVSAEICKCIWSPKMDLLAVANIQGQVAMHRLSWQRVWALAPPSENIHVTDMAWRPDSKVLAVGYTSGKVLLINIEDSTIIHQLSFFGQVTSLYWTQFQDVEGELEQTPKEDPWAECMYPLPSLNKVFEEGKGDQWQDPRLLQSQTSLTILSIGTLPSVLHLYAFGLFHVATLDIGDSVTNVTRILNIMSSPDLSMFTLILERKSEETTREVAQITLRTNLLAERHQELCSLAQKYGQVYSLMTYIKHTISHIEEAWEISLLEMDAKLASHAAMVPEQGVSADFLDLLVFGYSSSEFEIFLTNTLTEKFLKKLRQSVELSYSNMQKLVVRNLKAVGLTLVFLLSQVVGMARQTDRYAILGVTEDTVVDAMREAGSFLLKAGEMLQVIDSSMQDYQGFLKWVSAVQLRFLHEQVPPELNKISQQEISNIINFLNESFEETIIGADGEKTTRFRLERVGQYLANEDLKIPSQTETPWVEFIKNTPEVAAHPFIFSHIPNKSLIQQHLNLTSTLTKMGSQPAQAISDSITVGPSLSLVSLKSEGEPIVSQICSAKEKLIYTSIIASSNQKVLYLTQCPTGTETLSEEVKNVSHMVTGAPFIFSSLNKNKSLSDTMSIVDTQFYCEDIVSVLLHDHDDTHCPTFSQLRLSYFSKEFRCLSLPSGFPLSEVGVPPRDASSLLDPTSYRRLESGPTTGLAVSGSRKVAAVIGDSRRRVRIYEMEVDEEEEEDETTITDSTVNVSNVSDEHIDVSEGI